MKAVNGLKGQNWGIHERNDPGFSVLLDFDIITGVMWG